MRAIVLLLTLTLNCTSGWADNDVQRIPIEILQESKDTPSSQSSGFDTTAIYAEINSEFVRRRTDLAVPAVSLSRTRQVNRALLDVRSTWKPGDAVNAGFSGRLTAYRIEDKPYEDTTARLDLRELYLYWRPGTPNFVGFGRINLRTGVAMGFNPTDYFKTRSLVDTTTRDPSVLRENRLGTVMLQAQHLWESGSLLFVAAPQLSDTRGLAEATGTLNPRLAQTNGETRWLIKTSAAFGEDFSPELVLFKSHAGWRVGANLTRSIGNHSTVYAEWSAGRRKSLFGAAIDYGIDSGDLPAAVSSVVPTQASASLQNDLAVGWTWSSKHKLMLTTEFHYHQAGLSRGDWDRWFELGSGGANPAQAALYIRNYAAVNQEPLARRSLFLRAQQDHLYLRDLYATGFINMNLDDHSLLAQLALEYRFSSANRLRAALLMTRGRPTTQFGSDPGRVGFLLGYSHYF